MSSQRIQLDLKQYNERFGAKHAQKPSTERAPTAALSKTVNNAKSTDATTKNNVDQHCCLTSKIPTSNPVRASGRHGKPTTKRSAPRETSQRDRSRSPNLSRDNRSGPAYRGREDAVRQDCHHHRDFSARNRYDSWSNDVHRPLHQAMPRFMQNTTASAARAAGTAPVKKAVSKVQTQKAAPAAKKDRETSTSKAETKKEKTPMAKSGSTSTTPKQELPKMSSSKGPPKVQKAPVAGGSGAVTETTKLPQYRRMLAAAAKKQEEELNMLNSGGAPHVPTAQTTANRVVMPKHRDRMTVFYDMSVREWRNKRIAAASRASTNAGHTATAGSSKLPSPPTTTDTNSSDEKPIVRDCRRSTTDEKLKVVAKQPIRRSAQKPCRSKSTAEAPKDVEPSKPNQQFVPGSKRKAGGSNHDEELDNEKAPATKRQRLHGQATKDISKPTSEAQRCAPKGTAQKVQKRRRDENEKDDFIVDDLQSRKRAKVSKADVKGLFRGL